MRWVVLVTVPALVLAGAAVLWMRAQWIDGKISAATVKPAALDGPISLCVSKPEPFVMIGDSRIAQWPMPLFHGAPVVNRGIAGETVMQLTARFDRDALACHPRSVLIAAGINDLVAASMAPERMARDIVARLPDMLIGLAERAAKAGAAVSIATVIPPAQPDWPRRLVWSDSIRGYVSDVNARLRAHPWVGNVTLTDFAAALDASGTGTLPDRFRRDTLHLNTAAYECLMPLLPTAEGVSSDPCPPRTVDLERSIGRETP